jgi:hypothetical protein
MPQSRHNSTGAGEHTRLACAGGRRVRRKKPTKRAFLRFTLFARASVRREARRNCTRGGGAPLLCLTLLAESGRGRPHSMTLRVCPCARFMRQLLDCASPLALSTSRNNLAQGNVWVTPVLDDAPPAEAEAQPRQGRHRCRNRRRQFPSSVRSGPRSKLRGYGAGAGGRPAIALGRQ